MSYKTLSELEVLRHDLRKAWNSNAELLAALEDLARAYHADLDQTLAVSDEYKQAVKLIAKAKGE
jgi:ABC-type transporter Mla subunit MlaD